MKIEKTNTSHFFLGMKKGLYIKKIRTVKSLSFKEKNKCSIKSKNSKLKAFDNYKKIKKNTDTLDYKKSTELNISKQI